MILQKLMKTIKFLSNNSEQIDRKSIKLRISVNKKFRQRVAIFTFSNLQAKMKIVIIIFHPTGRRSRRRKTRNSRARFVKNSPECASTLTGRLRRTRTWRQRSCAMQSFRPADWEKKVKSSLKTDKLINNVELLSFYVWNFNQTFQAAWLAAKLLTN